MGAHLARALSIAILGGGLSACAGAPPVEAPVQERGSAAAATTTPPAVSAGSAAVAEDSASPGWITDETTGVALARKQGKPVVLSFEAAWCTATKELERRTFSDAEVQATLRKLVAIRIDATDDEAPETARLVKKYAVAGLPTIVVLDRGGREVARVTEVVAPNDLLAILAKASPR